MKKVIERSWKSHEFNFSQIRVFVSNFVNFFPNVSSSTVIRTCNSYLVFRLALRIRIIEYVHQENHQSSEICLMYFVSSLRLFPIHQSLEWSETDDFHLVRLRIKID